MRTKHLVPLLLFVGTGLVYWDVAGFEFVNFDDNRYVTGNPFIRDGLSWESVHWAVARGHTLDGNWVPLTWLSLTIDAQLFGANAGGFHVTNVVLHALNAVLLYFVLRWMTGAHWKSGFVAALFALHPLHVESVAWVAERKDVLSTFFGFLALAGYVRYAQQPERNEPGRVWYLFALLCFLASLMSKQMLVTLPFLLLLLDYWPLRRIAWTNSTAKAIDGPGPGPDPSAENVLTQPVFPPQQFARLLLEKVPFLLITVGFSTIAFLAQRAAGTVSTLEERPLGDRLANALVAYVLYLRKMLWPDDLAVFYPHPVGGIATYEAAGAACILLLISGVAVWQARRRPYLLVGWLWYLGMLVPVIGIVPIGLQRMADRYTYIPLIGLYAALTWLAVSFSTSTAWKRWAVSLAGAALLVACTISARAQVQHWRNGETLFAHAVAVTGDNSVAQNFLGEALLKNGQAGRALECVDEAIRLQSNFTLAHCNRARALAQLERHEEATAALERAAELDPSSHLVRTLLADAYRDAGRKDEAIEQYELALTHAPHYVAARTNLANVLRELGQLQEAVDHYRTALQTDASSVVTHSNLGTTLFRLGEPDDAIFHLREALRLDPQHVPTLVNLVLALRALGQSQEAAQLLRQLSKLDPQAAAKAGATESDTATGEEPD